ncbi:MAG: argininosuccinate lyase [Cyclobacteriaceae bacterium]|nr:argininosuccinate lyase [Cyclobacteriaceae bacterium]
MAESKNKLWQKDINVHDEIDKFTVGMDRELDLLLAKYDVLGSLAHIKMLTSIGLLEQDELEILSRELTKIHGEIESGNFKIEEGVEDVHSQVELMLTHKLGDVGKKIHSGRSRNDQVLLDLKLFMRAEVLQIVELVQQLFDRLISLSNQYKDTLLPGYTHLQVAMPSSFGLWFGAYAESLADDLSILKAAFDIVNRNPLGSAAGYGSSFPLNRQMTSDLLGFESMNYNVVYAQMGRGKAEKVLTNAMATIAETIGKFSMDVCLYMGQNHGFISFPDEYTTGSSIMPHKKNPDVFELIRARSNKLKALPNEISMITSNLPSGYHRDLQLIKESFMPAFENLKECLYMTRFMLEKIKVREDLLNEEKYKYLFSVELVNQLVLGGIPFRDAYLEVGRRIEKGEFEIPSKLDHTHEGSLGNLCNDKIEQRFQFTFNFFEEQRILISDKEKLLLDL